jgi:hypothetical protein
MSERIDVMQTENTQATKVISLPDLPRVLMEYTGGATKTYKQLYSSVMNGAIPVTRTETGRWLVKRSDLPKIASILGLKKGA